MDDDEDARAVELSTIAAIYPDEICIDDADPYSFTVEVPVSLSKPVVVRFPAVSSADSAPHPQTDNPEAAAAVAAASAGGGATATIDSQELSNLPSLALRVTLPEGYPETKPPTLSITTSPPWLSTEIIRKLEGNAERLWEEMGHDQVVFNCIDDVQQEAGDVFGLVAKNNTLEVSPEHKIAILDYDNMAKRKAFEKETFDCGICLDPKKGAVCHRMLDCGHVFCIQCLQDFYNNAITEGDVASVRCLEPKCAEERESKAKQAAAGKRRKPKTLISPSELLQIPLDQDTVKRYVTLKHKTELESDKNTVYCPRSWCQGAARSKKHKKPQGLEFAADSDYESDEENGKDKSLADYRQDLLAICEDCSFAFCSRCGQSWHGEFKYCIPKERKGEITEEEKASLDYLKMHTTPCPTCASPCQKTHGCNHMRCFRCQTHFCYLCSAWLDPSNPYRHFNMQPGGEINGCYMRLWELEGGDGADVGIGFGGGDALRNANVEPGQYGQHLEIVQVQAQAQAQAPIQDESDDESEADVEDAPPPHAAPAAGARQQPAAPPAAPQAVAPRNGEPAAQRVAREGPLVLRIEGNAPAARGGRGGAGGNRQPAVPAGGGRGAAQAVNEGRQGGGRGHHRGGQAAPGINRQNNRQRGQGQNHPVNRNARNGHNVENGQQPPPAAAGGGGGQLNQVDEAWVRHFVQLALNDEEHLVDWDSGDED
ncbi:RWD domain-containing protein [Apiospora arundinis]|uniref:RBR-type E3 ubiquitin transferase n=1 Tax=Apiospora arundinis TaxID=335852 RepID=A0ABR2I2J2_9PEZI